jgi:hypothetical protein
VFSRKDLPALKQPILLAIIVAIFYQAVLYFAGSDGNLLFFSGIFNIIASALVITFAGYSLAKQKNAGASAGLEGGLAVAFILFVVSLIVSAVQNFLLGSPGFTHDPIFTSVAFVVVWAMIFIGSVFFGVILGALGGFIYKQKNKN